jgi:hypothetical protein
MTPIVGGVFEPGERTSFEREKPYATSDPAAATPIVTATRVKRDRLFDSIASPTAATLTG